MIQKRWIVTFKLQHRHKEHDPANKKTGECPLGPVLGLRGVPCTDITGQHHSVLVWFDTLGQTQEWAKSTGVHVTRIELA